ncbi:MAG: SNF2-related protein [Candidatus Zhuqueibacterota bacterium]
MNSLPEKIMRQIPSAFLIAGWKIYSEGKYKYFDFVRNSYTSHFKEKRGSYWTTIRKHSDQSTFQTYCTCNSYLMNMNCPHVAALFFIIYGSGEHSSDVEKTLYKNFETSIWVNIAKLCYEHWQEDKLAIACEATPDQGGKRDIRISGADSEGLQIFKFILTAPYRERFLLKYRWQFFEHIEEDVFPWSEYNDDMEFLTADKSELEIRMNMSGYKSWQQKFEDSYWYDFAKAWYLGYEDQGYSVVYSEKEMSLKIFSGEDNFEFCIPNKQISSIISKLAQNEAIRDTLNISQEKLQLNYSLEINDAHDLIITPVLIFPDNSDPIFCRAGDALKPVIFGKYLYLQNRGFFQYERAIKYFDANIFNLEEVRIPNDSIPKLMQDYKKYFDKGEFHYVSPSLKNKDFDLTIKNLEIHVESIEDDWLFLSLNYSLARETVSLYDIYQALRTKTRYIIGQKTWIDMQSSGIEWIKTLIDYGGAFFELDDKHTVRLKLNKMNFLRLRSQLPAQGKISAHPELIERIDLLQNLKSSVNCPSVANRKYDLREYQKNGYEWLWFLYENRLAGLLCDDMGLGKTYQSLALIDGVTMFVKKPTNFLVVCPTSVLPHWHDKLFQLKKKVNVHLYYGGDRDLDNIDSEKYSVILTSYGILRNDFAILSKIAFEVAIFDEIQTGKNKASLTNAALNQLQARVKIGLTGTPIENSLSELKALIDIILPSYLGSDAAFRTHYIVPIERNKNMERLEELHRIIQPFVLRRTKVQVLQELPPKTEEVRKCELSAHQVKLYQDVINSRAQLLIAQLLKQEKGIPYIHIFSVLSSLKQICNHPSQMEDGCTDYNKYQSGKWDLFCELLEESLGSGFKVVVFSQYLNMLGLIEAYLKDNHIQFATIKGSTRNRREMIDEFNKNPKCQVFTGSLKASGYGIDLIGGSVVIHYDRWWNAAREDQATDRVHRIGQTRGVQVFKLVTEGTLEEKIDRLISKKKKLMEELIREDEADMVKSFTREEMIDLLTFDMGE